MVTARGSRGRPRQIYRVPSQKLSAYCEPQRFAFASTEEVEPLAIPLIGQDKALRAMDFGMAITQQGFHIFVTGPVGTGKSDFALSRVKERAADRDIPPDLLIVHNFKQPERPLCLFLPAGRGCEFREDIKWLYEEMRTGLRKAIEDEEFEQRKNEYLQQVEAKLAEAFYEMEESARLEGFVLQKSSNGIFTVPLNDSGKAMTKEEFEDLEEEERQLLSAKERKLEMQLAHIVRRTRSIQKETTTHLGDMEKEAARQATVPLVEILIAKYEEIDKVKDYLFAMQEDVVRHLDEMKESNLEGEKTEQVLSLSTMSRIGKKETMKRYEVNLFVDRSKESGAPVVIEMNPTYNNLFGKLEYRSTFGSLVTDFTMFKAGAIHKANGGYLILPAKELLTAPGAWDGLKRILKKGEMTVENLGDHLGLSVATTIKPEPIPIDLKVVLLGHPKIYNLLYQWDEDFQKLFKVRVDFASYVERQDKTMDQYAAYISTLCRQEKLLPFDAAAVAAVIDDASRRMSHQLKLSVNVEEMRDLLVQSSLWAKQAGAQFVGAEHIEKAVEEKRYRRSRLEEQVRELMQEGTILIDTDGAVLGQVNALALVQQGDYIFGKPSRITASLYMGRNGIVNIERETHMSGQSHSKGILILSSFFASRFAKDRPLAFSATLTFEQLYEGVDGDSASSAELYALMSLMADLPLDQSIAVTGSVNQKGEIQPIGGVNEKVESFFYLCKKRGLTGKQGVIIPVQNLPHLMLHRDVIQAVEDEFFHIYAIKNVDEGIAILTGLEAGEMSDEGLYPADSVNGRIADTLQAMNDKWRKLQGPNGKSSKNGFVQKKAKKS
ncbi:Lon protease family protein [Heliorestis convoluta]|uniref:endopeptidase La n=1 Tax=Heliorestis convoluta TaxID=356322 RepID=A0A5Q2N321_9FIRM|nr:ATP-binding protein [Heliorestis convoluta]QGG49388.1 ATP-dependent protease [Heliorestis convoluta]